MIEAVGEYLLVKPIKPDESKNGLILPKTQKEYDLVEIVSSDCEEFEEGEKGFTFLHCGNEIIWNGEKYYFIPKQYIHGILVD